MRARLLTAPCAMNGKRTAPKTKKTGELLPYPGDAQQAHDTILADCRGTDEGFEKWGSYRLDSHEVSALTIGDAADHALLLAIQEQMDGVEWNSDTFERIAQLMVEGGYRIRDCNDVDRDGER
jgi:hypothetical protein